MPTMKELEKENARLKEQVAGLEKRIQERQAQAGSSRPSKSREQAEAVKAILDKDGKITKEQLAQINPKYPSDGIYYAKNLLKLDVRRAHGCYWLPKALEAYEEQLKKEQEAKKAAAPKPAPAPPQQAAQ